MQLFSTIFASLLLLGYVNAGVGTTSSAARRALAEAKALETMEEVEALEAAWVKALKRESKLREAAKGSPVARAQAA